MKDAIYDIQKSIYSRLKNNVSFDVYDNVPDDAQTDFVEIQPVVGADNSGKQYEGQILTFNLACWTTYKGNKRISEMFTEIGTALTFTNSNTPNLIVSDNFTISYMERTNTLIDSVKFVSEFKYQGVMTIEIWVNPK
jgi:hypothetical protein